MVGQLRYISVDDEPHVHRILNREMARLRFFTNAGSFCDPRSAIEALERQDVDLLFLDVEMPHFSGLQLLEKLESPPITVLITGDDQFAADAYRLGVRDYILKPFSTERLVQAIERVTPLIMYRRNNGVHSSTPIPFKSGYEEIFVDAEDIVAVDADGNFSRLITTGGPRHVSASIKELEERLRPYGVTRSHKSHLVRAEAISCIRADTVFLQGDLSRPVGRTFAASLKAAAAQKNLTFVRDLVA